MAAEPANLNTVSLHLSRTLDEIGLNELTIKRRRQTFLFREQLRNVEYRLISKPLSFYHFGSQTEGATTPGLVSDLDTLMCCQDVKVIQDWSDWEYSQKNLLMLQERTAPGYCRLQVLKRGVPMAEEQLTGDESSTFDSYGRVIVKNTALFTHDPLKQQVRNGPAMSMFGGSIYSDRDFVKAFLCNSWPTQAEGFIKRHRRHGWPSQRLLQKAVKHGVFLVPVGYKLSHTEHLEWRISASLAERCLMLSLDTVHIKCYVVLKMLMKTFIEPRVAKCISSYHCKTALLYSIENTEPGFWRDDNLLQCATQCLTMLLTWVTDGFCPHFIIAEENLFVGKVTAQNRSTIQSLLKYLIKNNGLTLLHVHIDDLGQTLQAKLSTEPSVVPVLDSNETAFLIGEFEYNRNKDIHVIMRDFIVRVRTIKLVVAICSVYRSIVLCKDRIRQSEKHERQANEVYIENLSRRLGSLIASFSLSNDVRVPRMAIQLLCVGAYYDVAAKLSLASVLYSNGDFREAETTLRGVEHHVCSNVVQSICACYPKLIIQRPEFAQNLILLRGGKARALLFARCVMFSSHEMHCVPPALQYEFFKAIGGDVQHRDPTKDKWMDLAAVDSLPFMYYLQYMTYSKLGQLDLQNQSLLNMRRCLRKSYGLCHLETGWNLLGQCMELQQETEAAMGCFRTSLEIRTRNNAANWHIAVLCYKLLKPHIENMYSAVILCCIMQLIISRNKAAN